MYKVGDKVVYPHHGAGTVVKREKREVLGEKREYLTIKILHNDMTVNVPADNAERVGLRKVIDEGGHTRGIADQPRHAAPVADGRQALGAALADFAD